MSWNPPAPPGHSIASRVAYWRAIETIPADENGAVQLRQMAAQRLEQLGVASTTVKPSAAPRPDR